MSLVPYTSAPSKVMFAMVGLMTASFVVGEQLKKNLNAGDQITREVARRCFSLAGLLEVNQNLNGVYSDCRERAIVNCAKEQSEYDTCAQISEEASSCESVEALYGDCLDKHCLEEKTALEKVYDAFISVKALCASATQQAESKV
ncbi:MAG: hypothetical protein K2Y01_06165 [Rhabdochlamydiaceae bacterium]|nr:hypothetical protein [Rhabdochlamydiaceae bacterium]